MGGEGGEEKCHMGGAPNAFYVLPLPLWQYQKENENIATKKMNKR